MTKTTKKQTTKKQKQTIKIWLKPRVAVGVKRSELPAAEQPTLKGVAKVKTVKAVKAKATKRAARMTPDQKAKMIAQAVKLRADGLSFRAMELQLFGAEGSGTKAFNLFNAAPKPKANGKGKKTAAKPKAVIKVQTKTAPNGAQVVA